MYLLLSNVCIQLLANGKAFVFMYEIPIEIENSDMPIIQKLFKNHNGATLNEMDTINYNNDDDENFTINDGLGNEKSSEKSNLCLSSKYGNLLKNNTIEKYVDNNCINQKEEVDLSNNLHYIYM